MLETAIILAGGQGTRLRSVISDIPKPMAPVNGRPFLEHQLDYFIEQGIRQFVIAVGYLHDKIIDHFGSNFRGASIRYSIELAPLGTGGALRLAASQLEYGSSFVVSNGDTFFSINLKKMVFDHNYNRSDWTFAVFKSADIKRYTGIIADDTGKVISIANTPPNRNGLDFVNGGIYLTNREFIDKVFLSELSNTSLEADIFPLMLTDNHNVYIYLSSAEFIDIGIPADYARAYKIIGTPC